MEELNATSLAPFDHELATVRSPVVRPAQSEQILRLIATAVRAQLHVMHIDERRMSATWNAAAALIAQEHRTA